jgi:site-specific recombinase XerD
MHIEITQFKSWLTCQYPTSSTSVHYTSDLVLFFAWISKPPAEITAQDVDDFIAHCKAKGHAATTINRRLTTLNTFYYFLKMIEDDPAVCPVQKRHFLSRPRPLPRDAQNDDIQRLFSALQNPRDRAMVLIMLECGLRVGEIRNLSLGDFFQDNGIPWLTAHGKGDKRRAVPISPLAQDALQEWLKDRPITADRAVFISRNKNRISVSGIQSMLRELCVKTGIDLTCHQFRHTFGRRMAEAGMSVSSLQKLLGHESLRTTQRYVHLSDPHLRAEYEQATQKVQGLLA